LDQAKAGPKTSNAVPVMHHKDDITLVNRVLARERTAFDEFFKIYFARLTRFCAARVRQPEVVEDIVQETMVKVMKNLHTYRGEALLFSWICQICRNEISSWYRKHGRAEELTVSIDDNPAVRGALESFGLEVQNNLAQAHALKDMVQLTLDYLPDNYAKALEWKYLEGLSVKEISQRLGVGLIATQSILARARRAFRSGFSDLQQELALPNRAEQT
jgi:RNA polymerase sigma-70 factor, ECF subfamily